MKYLSLLYLLGLMVIVISLQVTDDYTLSIIGPPANGLPELFYGDPAHAVSAPREILAPEALPASSEAPAVPSRRLIYRFHLSSGTYDHLQWVGRGVPLPSILSVRNCWGRDVAFLNTTGTSPDDILAASKGPLILPSPGIFSVLGWLLKTLWVWILCILVFLLLQQPLAAWTRRLLELSSSRFRWGMIDGRIVLLTIIALSAVWISLMIPGAIRFDVGDDPAMEMLSCGYVTGHPSEYLVFINVSIGLFLKGLYGIVPSVPWYPLLHLATTIFCLGGITFFLLRDDLPDRFCWLWLFAVVFGVYFVTHLQFTSAAYLLGLFGILIFSQGTSRRSLLPAIGLVAAGSLVRFESFLLLFVTTACAAWLLSRRRVIDKVIFFAAILFLGWAGKTFDRAYYQRDVDWQTYRQYLVYLGDMHMTPKINFSEKNHAIYQRIGWSRNDFNMFAEHWLYEDAAAFSADKLAYLDQHLVSDQTSFRFFIALMVAIAFAPAPALLFVVMLLHRLERRKRSWLILASIVIPILLVWVGLAFSTRLPARVAVPVLYASCLFLLVAVRGNGEISRRLKSTRALPLIFVTLAVLSLSGMWSASCQNDLASNRLEASLKWLMPYSDKTLIGSINAVQLERLNPFIALADTQNLHLVHLMWSGGSPSFALQLQRHGSTSLFQSIASDPNFWLIIPTSQWERADCFSLYMQEHYHETIKMTPVILKDGQAAVFPDFTVMQAERVGSL